MNNLSLFLYLADVIGNFQAFFVVSATVAVGVSLLVLFVALEEEDFNRKPLITTLFVGLFFFFLAAFLPSKETIYLIAGSEAGEVVVNSEQGKEILDGISKVINSQLEKLQ